MRAYEGGQFYEFMTFVKLEKCDYLYSLPTFTENLIMSTLQWSESLVPGLPFMDDTPEEFVDLLAPLD